MTEPITIPDATRQPDEYVEALLTTLGNRDALQVYAATPREVQRLCSGLDQSAWLAPLGAGEWNATQILGHLFDVDVVYGFRWRMCLTENNPTYPGYNEKEWSRLARPPAQQLMEAFTALRNANAALMDHMGPEDWQRGGVHGEQGGEDVRKMLNKIAGHDLAHLNQLHRTVEAATPARTAGLTP